MKEQIETHWAIRDIAEQQAPAKTIHLWERVERAAAGGKEKQPVILRRRWIPITALCLILLTVFSSMACFVPPVRAFAAEVIQRLGIALVDTGQFNQDVEVVGVEAIRVTPPPSLSIAEIRRQISFSLMQPSWLPAGLDHYHGSIAKYDPIENQNPGSGTSVSLYYYRSADHDFLKGVLYLRANDGPIPAPPLLAQTREQEVTVNGQPGIYVHGAWQDDGSGDPNLKMGTLQWDDQADDAYLSWEQDGVTYLLEAHNLGLGLDDLLKIAASMTYE